MIFWIWIAALVAAAWLYFKNLYSQLNRRGLKNLPTVPFLGNAARIMLRLNHFADDIEKTYFTFPDEKFVGRYEFMSITVVIRDLEMIKKVTIKDFEHFLDHRIIINKESDPLFGRNLFSMKGQEWKDMRSTLSPAFTSSKIRVMVPFMVEVGDQMIKTLTKKIKESKDDSNIKFHTIEDYIDIDMKDLTTRYGTDVIASCAFGLKVDSLTDEDNQFYTMGKEASNFKFRQLLMFLVMMSFPKLIHKVKMSLFSDKVKHFFRNLVEGTMKDREDRNIIRPDMIHLLMEAKKGKLTYDAKTGDADAGFATVEESAVGKKEIDRVWTNDDLTAQAVLFFIAGFETVSSAMSFMFHELAVNPDVQEKLIKEIRENEANNKGSFDYNSIQKMSYLDMVVSETLRLWPPVIATDRVCTKDYNMGKPNDKATEDFILRKGEGVNFPVWAIHRDPDYFPDPLKFDPERFSDENKHNIKPFTYMPFGLGPRNCIGSRFALCEIKVMAYQLLRSMEISPGAKTSIPAQLSVDTFNIRIKGGHWVRLRFRE